MTSAFCNEEIEPIYIHYFAHLALRETTLWLTRLAMKESKQT